MTEIRQTISHNGVYSRRDRYHPESDITFSYLRIPVDAREIGIDLFQFESIQKIERVSRLGVFIFGRQENDAYALWLPEIFTAGFVDEQGRISPSVKNKTEYRVEYNNAVKLFLQGNDPVPITVDFGFIVAKSEGVPLIEKFACLQEYEKKKYIKSNWFRVDSPGDFWKYMIFGTIYDPIPGKGSGKRYACQQCAYSWWRYFEYLMNQTSKTIYKIFQDEIAYAVDRDMDASGGWKHGAWSDEMETHARFQLDGIQLLLSQYERTQDHYWLTKAELAMNFMLETMTDQASDGSVWFLHDTIKDRKTERITGKVKGGKDIHSYTVNTHVQALVVLAKMSSCKKNNEQYDEFIRRGLAGLKSILALSPAETLHRTLVPWFIKHRLRGYSARRKQKVIMHLENIFITKLYWLLRRRYPRIVYPNGFTARDLTLTYILFNYHVINVKDMLELYVYFPEAWLSSYIRKGVEYLRELTKKHEFLSLLREDYVYVEICELYKLYFKLIDRDIEDDLIKIENTIYTVTGGYSLDAVVMDTNNGTQPLYRH